MEHLKAISLFTGVGGIDFGFEAAGFRTAVAVEVDRACCRALRANRPSWAVVEKNINEVVTSDILQAGELEVGEADILIGGPPCQPFSKAGYWVRGDALRLRDPRATTLEAYLRVLEEAKPKAFLLENVAGLAFSGKDEGLSQVLRGIELLNARVGTKYKPSYAVLNAAHFGVPQLRERVFIIGSRDGEQFQFPSATHGDPDTLEGVGLQPFRTAWDAIGDLPASQDEEELKPTGKWADLLPTIPEGRNYLWHTRKGGGVPLFGWRTRYWSFLLKLAKDRPSWTIQAQPGSAIGPFHWANRKLSRAELSRLQTFPDGLTFPGSRSEVQRMLGNAVPSALAEILAWEIRHQLLDRATRPTGYSLLPPQRPGLPLSEAVQPISPKYLRLIGTYNDHPGEGLGTGARKRMSMST